MESGNPKILVQSSIMSLQGNQLTQFQLDSGCWIGFCWYVSVYALVCWLCLIESIMCNRLASVCLSYQHSHCDSPGGSMLRGQPTFWPDYFAPTYLACFNCIVPYLLLSFKPACTLTLC